jgi:Na+/H+ antiporter
VQNAFEILALVVAVAIVAGITRRLGFSPPLVLVIAGVIAALIPGVPSYRLDPDVVLIGLLPPLLYAAALRTSLVDVRTNRQAIGIMAVGAVLFTTLVVGLVAWQVVPGISLAAGLALGAIVAPPDAVAATTIARRVGMPRRIVSILEGESLLNDAAALVSLRTAVLAITTSVTVWQVVGDVALAAGGGLAVGLGVATILAGVRRHVQDPVLDTTLSLVAPFVAYLPAQAIHASGVLAVVVTGVLLGHKAPILQSASSRLSEQTYWRTVAFVLENTVFMLIGLQLPNVVSAADKGGLGVWRLVGVCAAVLVATIVSRLVWVFAATAIYRFGPTALRRRAWDWSTATLVSWAGMRGVVTLAAAFILPADTPQREVLVVAAFTVVAGTLLIQGPTLPALVRRLGLPGPDLAEDALQEAALLSNATRAGLECLEQIRRPDDDPDVIDQLEQRTRQRANSAWERLGRSSVAGETPSEAYRRMRLQMLAAERDVVLRARDTGGADDEVLRDVLMLLDSEESLLDRLTDKSVTVDRELTARADREEDCAHLAAAPTTIRPRTPEGCEACLAEGTRWVHLRLCLTCGRVGCCDSSPERHATRHFHESEHAVMRSFEPGEAWRWCYVDDQLG